MTILLNNVYVALEQGIINTDQALYLIYTHREITYPIKVKELFQLTQLKYIVGNKIGKELLIEENIKLALKGTIKPIYNTEVSKKIPAKILALVGVKDPVTEQLKFPSGEVTIQHTADNFLLGEGLIAYHYLISFIYVSNRRRKQQEMGKHFNNNFPYRGVRLRLRSKGTAGLFKSS
jgi:hypothetical protein